MQRPRHSAAAGVTLDGHLLERKKYGEVYKEEVEDTEDEADETDADALITSRESRLVATKRYLQRTPPLSRTSRLLSWIAVAGFSVWALWLLVLLYARGLLSWTAPASTGIAGTGFHRTRPCTADTFAQALPSYAAVERVDRVPLLGSYGEGTADLGFTKNATHLPPLCAVTVRVNNRTAGTNSNYRFALFLPTGWTWNGRMLTIGSYSFAGGINWPDMGQGPPYGFATLASDGGHNSTQDALDWNPTTPDMIADWGYRSMHGSVQLGKVLTEHYYSDAAIAYSYFSGCSTGGRQGLKEIQMDAESFDGALVGAPAWDTSRLMPWITRIGAANLAPGHGNGGVVLGPDDISLLAKEALKQCDHIDGHVDSIISRPEACAFDVSALDCSHAPDDACLSTEQVRLAETVLYADAYTGRGDFIHSGFSPGSEDAWYVYLSRADARDFDNRYERFWLYNDSRWYWSQYSDQTFYDSVAANPGNATADHYGIAPFRERGGKVLMYQGLADALVVPRMTTYYYNETLKAMNLTLEKNHREGIQDFFRYFQVPGMGHCYGTAPGVNAPWMFAAPGQATVLKQEYQFGAGWGVPNTLPNAEHDALLALVEWVEGGQAPESIVATVWDKRGTVNRTRPLCPFPEEAVYRGRGSINSASSWRCQ